ncbi:MAG: apolipoprotein N-acyltransferase [Streptosporangiaceae bacterium]
MALRRALAQPTRYLALASGALPVLAFPDPNLEYLAWFGLVPGLLLMRRSPTAREAAVRAAWFGAGFLLTGLYWLAPNIGPGLLLIAIVFGLLWAGVGVATWVLLRPPASPARAAAGLLVVPSCWLVIEWIRSWQALGGPWNVLGVSQWQHPAVLALAAVGGVWLVSFALVLCNTGILIALTAGRAATRLIGAAGAAAAIAAGPVAFTLTPAAPVTRHVRIALVQPGIVPGGPAARLAASERLTASGVRGAGLIVWAESSVGYDISASPRLLGQLRRLSAAVHAPLLASQDAVNPDGAKSKAAVLIGPGGITGEYVKTRLVPFGEYIPFRSALGWLTAISRAAAQNMVPGTGAHVLRARPPRGGPLTIGVLICFESAFPDMSRVDTDHGARVIVYQTSDSTFQDSWALAQHASLGAVRAAETGRPVVQAALTGDSAAFDDRGRLLAWMGSTSRGITTVTLALPAASARTPFDRLGDYVPWSATAIAVAAAALRAARALRRRPPGGPGHGQAAIGWGKQPAKPAA